MALLRNPLLGENSALIMGTSERRCKVFLKPIYDNVGPEKSADLINWHALIGCYTTGYIQGKGKKQYFSTLLTASPAILRALAGLGEADEPSAEVVSLCRVSFHSFLSAWSPHWASKDAQMVFIQATQR